MFAWINGTEASPPKYLAFRSSKVFVITSVAAAVFTDLFLYGVVVPVLPFALHKRAGVAEDEVQKWISILLAVYGAAMFATCPFAGWYADNTTSRRRPLLLGLLALSGATAILTAGNSIAVLILGRILQGMSGAVVWVVGLALVADTVGVDGVGEALGYMGLSMSIGVIIAPLIGGVVFERAGYYAVFGVSFALLGVDIVLRLALIEKRIAAKWLVPAETTAVSDQASDGTDATNNELKQHGSIESAELPSKETVPSENEVAAIPVVSGHAPIPSKPSLSQLPQVNERSQSIGSTLSQASVAAPKKRRLPTMITLLKSRRLLSSLMGCMIQSMLLTSFDSTVPLFVHRTFGWSSIGAGIIFLPLAIPSFIGPLVGAVSDRYGPRYLCFAGFLAISPLMILLRLIDHNSIQQKVIFCVILTLIGFALTCALTPIMAEITYCVEALVAKAPPGTFGERGATAQAYGLFNMAFAAGSMLGPLLAGLIVQSAGWPTATLVLGILSGAWSIPTWYWTGGSWRRIRNKRRKAAAEAAAASGSDVEAAAATVDDLS